MGKYTDAMKKRLRNKDRNTFSEIFNSNSIKNVEK